MTRTKISFCKPSRNYTVIFLNISKSPSAGGESPYPFIYYKFLRILEDWKKEVNEYKEWMEHLHTKSLNAEKAFKQFSDQIYESGNHELYRQLAFYQANDKTLFEVKRLIYSLLIVERKGRYSNNLVVDEALKTIFKE